MRTLLCLAVLGAVGSFADVAAEEPGEKQPSPDVAVELAGIKTQLKILLDTMLSDKKGNELADARLQTELNNLRDEVERLRRRVADNEREIQAGQQARIAKSIDPNPTRGTIQLNNRTSGQVTVFLNGLAYPLAAGQTRTLNEQPPGTFTYSVLAEGYGEVQSQRTRTLLDGEVKTITINP